jgi:hypothetical protein
MAEIKVQELGSINISGSDLFHDSESFMIELTEESEQIFGGCLPSTVYPRGTCTEETYSHCNPTTECETTGFYP